MAKKADDLQKAAVLWNDEEVLLRREQDYIDAALSAHRSRGDFARNRPLRVKLMTSISAHLGNGMVGEITRRYLVLGWKVKVSLEPDGSIYLVFRP